MTLQIRIFEVVIGIDFTKLLIRFGTYKLKMILIDYLLHLLYILYKIMQLLRYRHFYSFFLNIYEKNIFFS